MINRLKKLAYLISVLFSGRKLSITLILLGTFTIGALMQRFIWINSEDQPGRALASTLLGQDTIMFNANEQDYIQKTFGYQCMVTEGIPLPKTLKRGGHIGGVVKGTIIVAGGTDWSNDKSTKYWLKNSVIFHKGKWVAGPNLIKPLAYAMYASDSSGLYIAGGTEDGKSNSREAYKLTSLTESKNWNPLPPLPIGTSFGDGAILNGKFYVACGSVNMEKTDNMWVLDINDTSNIWRKCAPLPGVARILPSLVASEKYLYLLGGLAEVSPLTPLKDAYRYNPERNEWTRLPDLPFEGYAWTSDTVDNDHLIITGRAYGNVDKGIWIVDLNDMSMKKIGETIVPATTAPLLKAEDKQWWLVGGEPDSNKNRTGRVSVITLKNRCSEN